MQQSPSELLMAIPQWAEPLALSIAITSPRCQVSRVPLCSQLAICKLELAQSLA